MLPTQSLKRPYTTIRALNRNRRPPLAPPIIWPIRVKRTPAIVRGILGPLGRREQQLVVFAAVERLFQG